MKKVIILILTGLALTACATRSSKPTTMYHEKYGRVNVEKNKYFERDAERCLRDIKKYKSGSYTERLGVCMIRKGWQP